jgi:hypothetical protein
MNNPDPKMHFYISLVKSFLRLNAGACLMFSNLYMAGLLLIVAEVLGVLEEIF